MESLFTLIGLKWAGYFLSICKYYSLIATAQIKSILVRILTQV